jgi:hypothetical protein
VVVVVVAARKAIKGLMQLTVAGAARRQVITPTTIRPADTDEEAGAAGVALGRVAALTAVASIILVGHKAAVGLFGCAIQTRTQQLSLLEFLLIQRTPVAAI